MFAAALVGEDVGFALGTARQVHAGWLLLGSPVHNGPLRLLPAQFSRCAGMRRDLRG